MIGIGSAWKWLLLQLLCKFSCDALSQQRLPYSKLTCLLNSLYLIAQKFQGYDHVFGYWRDRLILGMWKKNILGQLVINYSYHVIRKVTKHFQTVYIRGFKLCSSLIYNPPDFLFGISSSLPLHSGVVLWTTWSLGSGIFCAFAFSTTIPMCLQYRNGLVWCYLLMPWYWYFAFFSEGFRIWKIIEILLWTLDKFVHKNKL